MNIFTVLESLTEKVQNSVTDVFLEAVFVMENLI